MTPYTAYAIVPYVVYGSITLAVFVGYCVWASQFSNRKPSEDASDAFFAAAIWPFLAVMLFGLLVALVTCGLPILVGTGLVKLLRRRRAS